MAHASPDTDSPVWAAAATPTTTRRPGGEDGALAHRVATTAVPSPGAE